MTTRFDQIQELGGVRALQLRDGVYVGEYRGYELWVTKNMFQGTYCWAVPEDVSEILEGYVLSERPAPAVRAAKRTIRRSAKRKSRWERRLDRLSRG